MTSRAAACVPPVRFALRNNRSVNSRPAAKNRRCCGQSSRRCGPSSGSSGESCRRCAKRLRLRTPASRAPRQQGHSSRQTGGFPEASQNGGQLGIGQLGRVDRHGREVAGEVSCLGRLPVLALEQRPNRRQPASSVLVFGRGILVQLVDVDLAVGSTKFANVLGEGLSLRGRPAGFPLTPFGKRPPPPDQRALTRGVRGDQP